MEPVVYGVVFLKYIFISLLGSLKVSFLEVLDLIWKKMLEMTFQNFPSSKVEESGGKYWKKMSNFFLILHF